MLQPRLLPEGRFLCRIPSPHTQPIQQIALFAGGGDVLTQALPQAASAHHARVAGYAVDPRERTKRGVLPGRFPVNALVNGKAGKLPKIMIDVRPDGTNAIGRESHALRLFSVGSLEFLVSAASGSDGGVETIFAYIALYIVK